MREVKLTEAEFREATALINEIGKLASDSHNEAVLMAGSLGVSSLVCLLNNGDQGNTETSQSLLGPFWRLNSPRVENGGTIVRSDTPGAALFVKGHVIDEKGQPILDAEIDIWHASPVGLYEQQDPEQAEMNLRGKFRTDSNGNFWFKTVMMIGYPIPTDRRSNTASTWRPGASDRSIRSGTAARTRCSHCRCRSRRRSCDRRA